MQFDQGARVFSMDGKPVGRADRVVIDLKTKEITHIVVHTGVFVTRDKVVPLHLVDAEEQDRLMLQLSARQLAHMPDFGTTQYRVVSEEELSRNERPALLLAPPAYWYPVYPAASIRLSVGQPQIRGTRVNIPAGTVAVKAGANVVSADGRCLGRAERVLTSPPTARVGYLQISKGRRFRERRMVPIEWVDQLNEDQVCLAVGAQIVEDLPE